MAPAAKQDRSASRGQSAPGRGRRSARMTGSQRREQLIAVALPLFAEAGFDGTSVEEIASRAHVSKPVVYEHFGGKEGLYAVVVDRELKLMLSGIQSALLDADHGHPKYLMERAALALLDYIEQHEDGFRILVRDSPVAQASGPFNSLLGDISATVETLLAEQFRTNGFDISAAREYAQMLVGMTALTGQWWAERRSPAKEVVAAHIVNLSWNGLSRLEKDPVLLSSRDRAPRAGRTREDSTRKDSTPPEDER